MDASNIQEKDMNIDNLTYGELRQIASMFNSATKSSSRVEGDLRPVIVRCRDAGVHYGKLVAYEGRTVWLKDSRRLWMWKAVEGIALSGVARYGVVAHESKLDVIVPNIALLDACEIIDASPEAVLKIEAA